jgi:hypothetical protein
LAAAIGVAAWDRPKALAVVEQLERDEDGIVAFDAEMVVQELRNPTSPLSLSISELAESEAGASAGSPTYRTGNLTPDLSKSMNIVYRFHGNVMSGGLAYALDTDRELGRNAAEELRRLGLVELAALIDEALRIVCRGAEPGATADISTLPNAESERLEALGVRYQELVPSDEDLARLLAN